MRDRRGGRCWQREECPGLGEEGSSEGCVTGKLPEYLQGLCKDIDGGPSALFQRARIQWGPFKNYVHECHGVLLLPNAEGKQEAVYHILSWRLPISHTKA